MTTPMLTFVLALLLSAIAQSAYANDVLPPLFANNGKSDSLDVQLAIFGVNMGAALIAWQRMTLTGPNRRISKKKNQWTVSLYPKDLHLKNYNVDYPDTLEEVQQWSSTAVWPALVVRGMIAAEVIKVSNGTMQDVSVKDCLLALSSAGGQDDGLKNLSKFHQQQSLMVLQTKEDAKVLKPNYAYALVEYQDTRLTLIDPSSDTTPPERVYRVDQIQGDIKYNIWGWAGQ